MPVESLIFVAAGMVGIAIGYYWPHRAPRRFVRELESIQAQIAALKLLPCKVVGVYGTAHTTIGDLDSGPPAQVRIDGPMFWFDLPLPVQRVSYRILSATVHLGGLSQPVGLDMVVRSGEHCTIIQAVRLDAFNGARAYQEPTL